MLNCFVALYIRRGTVKLGRENSYYLCQKNFKAQKKVVSAVSCQEIFIKVLLFFNTHEEDFLFYLLICAFKNCQLKAQILVVVFLTKL